MRVVRLPKKIRSGAGLMNKAQADLGEMSTSIGFETNVRASDEKTCLVKPKN